MTVPNQVTDDRSAEENRLIQMLVLKALLDPNLPFKLKGMLCSIVAASRGRGLSMAEIAALSCDGPDAVKQGVRKLIGSGYLVRHTGRNPDGTIGRTIYRPIEGESIERSAAGFAYAISAPGNRMVKIGCTQDLRQRLGALQSASPFPLGIIWRQVGGYALEQHLHEKFARRRIRGEWFDFTDVDAAALISRAAEKFELD